MKPLMKKLMTGMVVACLLLVSGCNSSEKEKEVKKTEEKKEEIKLIKNNRYVEPLSPTDAQIKAFNALSAAVETNQEMKNNEEEAKQVAISFVYDFFTLSNKKSRSDIGGLQFIPSDSIRKYMEYAEAYYYGNYPTIVNEYGKDSLPEVTAVKFESAQATQFVYNNTTSDGYQIVLDVTYAETDVKEDILKKKMTVNVIKIHDYDFNRSYNYTKRDLVFEGEMKNAYRVLAVA